MENIIRQTMTAQEAAEYLGISYWFITKLVKEKKIPHARLGKKILFRKESLDNFLEQQETISY